MVIGIPWYLEPVDTFFLEDIDVFYTEICTLPSGIIELPEESSLGVLDLYASFEHVTLKISKSGKLNLNLYDVAGRHIGSLAQGMFEKGTYLFTLPTNMSMGVYFVRADFEGVEKSAKLIKVR